MCDVKAAVKRLFTASSSWLTLESVCRGRAGATGAGAGFCQVRTYIHTLKIGTHLIMTYVSSMIKMLSMNGYRIRFRNLLDWNIGERNRWRCRRRAGKYRSLYRHGARYWVSDCKYLIWTITFSMKNSIYSSDRSKQTLFVYWHNSWCASCRCKYFHNK